MKEIERDNAASTCVAWTTTAMRLMNEAPDPGEIVQIFRYRLHPSGWSGSLADILTRRVPLLEYLTNDPNQRIAKSAQEAVASLKQEIDAERERERQRHRTENERFEW